MADLPTVGTKVQYLFGTEEKYQSLENKSDYAFYYTGENLYLGTWKLTTESDVQEALDFVGDLSDLTTTEQSSLVAAINELAQKVAASGGGDITTATDTTAGVVKLYSTTGDATDGTISQAALTEELDKKAEVSSTITDETLVINI